MGFKPLEGFFDAYLDLPIGSKVYRIESPDAETGMWAAKVRAVTQLVQQGSALDDRAREFVEETAALPDDAVQRRLLGAAYDEMLADKVPWEYVKHVVGTTLVWVTDSREEAERYWEEGGPKAPVQVIAPADRKPSTKASSRAASSRSTSSRPRKAVTAGPSSSTTGRSSKPISPTEG